MLKIKKNKKFFCQTCVRGSRQFQRRGGGGGGSNCFSSEVRTSFYSRKQWQLMIFMGRSGPPAPSVSAHIRVSNSLNNSYFFAGPGQFTKRLLIISADAKGKDSMIYLRSKRPRTSIPATCCFKFWGRT